MPGLEIMEKEALERLLADAPAQPGYVSVSVVGERSTNGRKRERQIGRVDCPEPRLLGRLGRIFRDAVPPGSSAKLRVRRYCADGHKTEQLVEVSHPRGPSIVDRLRPPDSAPMVPAPDSRLAERDATLPMYLTPIAGRPSETGSGSPDRPASSAAVVQRPGAFEQPAPDFVLADAVSRLALHPPQPAPPVDLTFVLAEMARLNAEVVRLSAELSRRDAELARRDADSVRQQARLDRQEVELRDVRKALSVVERERDQLVVRLDAEIAGRAADDEHMAAQLEELNEILESTPTWASLLR